MKPRYNRNYPLHGRYLTDRQTTPRPPRCADLPSRASQPHAAQPSVVVPSPPEPPNIGLVLENEISTDELNRFALCCIEQLASSGKEQPIEKLIEQAVEANLSSYSTLKAAFVSSRQAHRSLHDWTKQMVDAVEPLLKSESAPVPEQEKLSDLALQSVEQTMKLQHRVEQLGRRVEFLNDAVSQHLVQTGLEIGFSDAMLQKLARLTKSVLERYMPA
jgi:aryl carrier-like protein